MRLIDLIKTIEIPDIIPDKIIHITSDDYLNRKIFPTRFVYGNSRYFFQEGNEEHIYSISDEKFLLRIGYNKTRAIYYSSKPKQEQELILEDILLDIEQDESYLVLKYGKFLLEEII